MSQIMEADDEHSDGVRDDVQDAHAEAILLLQERVDDLRSRANVLETTQTMLYAMAFFASILCIARSLT